MMTFSVEVKEELSKIIKLNDREVIEAIFFGYLITSKKEIEKETIDFLTENEYNVEIFYKILFNLGLNYEPEISGKFFKTKIYKNELYNELVITEINNIFGFDAIRENELLANIEKINLRYEKEIFRYIVRGAFLSTGSINSPEKNYHLEINFYEKKYAEFVFNICKANNVNIKIMDSNEKFKLYIKDGEEISKFLALIGAGNSVMKFEEIRIKHDIKNNVNRLVNCETSNLSKTINASLNQVNDIKLLQSLKKFEDLSDELKEIANLRLQFPDATIKELGEYLNPVLGKSGVNHRLKKIHKIAEEYRKNI